MRAMEVAGGRRAVRGARRRDVVRSRGFGNAAGAGRGRCNQARIVPMRPAPFNVARAAIRSHRRARSSRSPALSSASALARAISRTSTPRRRSRTRRKLSRATRLIRLRCTALFDTRREMARPRRAVPTGLVATSALKWRLPTRWLMPRRRAKSFALQRGVLLDIPEGLRPRLERTGDARPEFGRVPGVGTRRG